MAATIERLKDPVEKAVAKNWDQYMKSAARRIGANELVMGGVDPRADQFIWEYRVAAERERDRLLANTSMTVSEITDPGNPKGVVPMVQRYRRRFEDILNDRSEASVPNRRMDIEDELARRASAPLPEWLQRGLNEGSFEPQVSVGVLPLPGSRSAMVFPLNRVPPDGDPTTVESVTFNSAIDVALEEGDFLSFFSREQAVAFVEKFNEGRSELTDEPEFVEEQSLLGGLLQDANEIFFGQPGQQEELPDVLGIVPPTTPISPRALPGESGVDFLRRIGASVPEETLVPAPQGP